MAGRLFFAAAIVAALTGCTGSRGLIVLGTRVNLHPYEGPIAKANADLVISAVSRGQSNEGTFSYELPGGAACEGAWSLQTNRTKVSSAALAGLGAGSGRLEKGGSVDPPAEGGRVFHALRGSEIYGAGTCTDGATFEFVSVANGAQGRGALRDSHGNIFRIVLR